MVAIVEATLTARTLGGLEIRPVEQKSKFLNILIYGNSGVGKTVLSGSADSVPSMRPVLFIDIEGGTESLRKSYPGVETIRVQTWKQMQEVYDDLHKGKHDYSTIVLDSLTEIQKFNMYNVMMDLVARKEEADPDIPGMREWGKNIEQMRRFVRGFRDLNMHTIFTALMRADKDDKTGIITMKPSLSGKLANEVAAFLDIVAYYYIKEVRNDAGETASMRLLLTQATERVIAKDRSDTLPMVIENPTMDEIINHIYTSEQVTPNTETEGN